MTDPNLLRRDRQDESRRLQQADEKIRELEKENERLRKALRKVRSKITRVHSTRKDRR